MLAEGENICKVYGISAESLKWKWEASNFSINRLHTDKMPPFTMESVTNLKIQLKESKQELQSVQDQHEKTVAGMKSQMQESHGPATPESKLRSTSESNGEFVEKNLSLALLFLSTDVFDLMMPLTSA